tara:strand:+ start:287 stop:463 length:177 start_codon:yes stop_codon:yes gene_type:complete
MKSRKFGHFELFKVVLAIVYLASGFLVFGVLVSSASQEFTKAEIINQEIDCMNCDEID